MRPFPGSLLALLLIGLLPAIVAAQAPAPHLHARQGFWIGVGVGPAHLSFQCGDCETTGDADPWGNGAGSTAWISLGGAVSPSLLLGGILSLPDRGTLVGGDGSERVSSLASILFVAHYFPRPASGFHLRGGMGLGFAALSDSGGASVDASGWTLQGGVGQDLRLGGRFTLTPFADAGMVLTPEVTGTYEGRRVGIGARPWYIQAGLGLLWY